MAHVFSVPLSRGGGAKRAGVSTSVLQQNLLSGPRESIIAHPDTEVLERYTTLAVELAHPRAHGRNERRVGYIREMFALSWIVQVVGALAGCFHRFALGCCYSA
eukprot:9487874-Pyramimonas_sp.AAC.1